MIKRLFRRLAEPLDPWLFLFVGLLISVSLITIYSASNGSVDKVTNKMVSVSVALLAMWLVANLKPAQLMWLAPPLYLLGVVLLVAVELFGITVNGATRWLNIGIGRIQPSELLKLAVPMMVAWYFQRHESWLQPRHYAVAAAIIGVPVLLVLKQPDLGTSLLISAAGFYALFLAGLSWRVILPLVAMFLATIWFVGDFNRCASVFHDYQCHRVQVQLDPMADPLGKGYHIIQGTIAIGSGGITGKGWMNGTQTRLDFIPERTTDFIFAVYSEEFGLIGCALLLALYLCVIVRGLMIANSASSLFGRLLAGALTLSFFTYAFVNIGMVAGLLPVVGVPLPLVSYGGTAMLSILIGFGMLMSIQRDRKLIKR
ncbi:rod shape-determining protein RodA [Chitinimonas sp. BJYL2]|uniref:rod shape-determining protein RodA n=1 Tax=Chitinimonas sp. BJYL2 TaxID=2976696 RepID=UPI0022B33AED|nr:rod shape-determining protein RodA [Chitinimonas sp. BJYL2]